MRSLFPYTMNLSSVPYLSGRRALAFLRLCRFYSGFVFVLLLLVSCDSGLDPVATGKETEAKPSISGLITYKNGASSWPPADSIKDIRVVAFTRYPPPDIIAEVLGQKAFFTEAMPVGVDSSSYRIELPSPLPAGIAAIVVAQQYGNDITKDWRVIGIYSATGDNTQPTALDLTTASIWRNINITVDFSNLPPQPF
jgi:hypothetical protein